jgi:hypothetical protein
MTSVRDDTISSGPVTQSVSAATNRKLKKPSFDSSSDFLKRQLGKEI